jgi:hypothetical protein
MKNESFFFSVSSEIFPKQNADYMDMKHLGFVGASMIDVKASERPSTSISLTESQTVII